MPDAFKHWYQANLEQQRARRRLKKLGLRPRRIQRVYASDRRANDRAGERSANALHLTSRTARAAFIR